MGTSSKVVIAHRGASGYLPEHTVAAKVAAHTMGAHYIEQDVVLSRDGVPVVLHDVHIDSVTNVAEIFPDRARPDGRFYAIDFALEELQSLVVMERSNDAGEQAFPERFPRGAGRFAISTLAEEIQLIQGLNRSLGREAGIYPEIKAPAWHHAEGHDLAAVTLGVLSDYGYAEKSDRMFLQCFDWNETRRIRQDLGYRGKLVQLIAENSWGEAPDVDYEALRSADGLAEIAKVADGVGPWVHHVVSGVEEERHQITDLVANAQALGLEVHPYTLRADALPHYAASLEDLLRLLLIDAGVDGVFTDHPDRAVAFVRDEMASE